MCFLSKVNGAFKGSFISIRNYNSEEHIVPICVWLIASQVYINKCNFYSMFILFFHHMDIYSDVSKPQGEMLR